MGLDIYAGTLTRYYTQNWKTVTQQWAEENGIQFNRIVAGGEQEQEEKLSPEEMQAIVEDWRDRMLAAVTPEGKEPYAPWPENNEKDYYTDKPDWQAFEAMLLVAACKTYGEDVPQLVDKNGEIMDHPLIQRLMNDQERMWSLFKGAIWWLPIEDSFFFQGPLPNNNSAIIGTTGCLRSELEWLNKLAWQASEEAILSWTNTEGYPVDGEITADGKLSKEGIKVHTQYDTQSLAKFAFSIFYRALKFAEENRVPILMDY